MNGGAYYNENDPYCAEWLCNLIAAGHIASGEVDTRSICDVAPDDVRGFTQVHLFAGIGGWSLALRLAGIGDGEPIWTGSCPCQPFSTAGKRKGAADERHLWPEMYRLVAACKPERVLGEQVEAAVRLGWIDGVFGDLAREDYACGFAVLGAHSVGAPHIRQRIYWVADAEHAKRRAKREADGDAHGRNGLGRCGHTDGGMGDTALSEEERQRQQPFNLSGSTTQWLADAMLTGRPERRSLAGERPAPWSGGIYIPCADGKARRVEPGIQPLAHGVSARVGKLRAAGNAIVPQVAAEFIRASFGIS